MYDLLFPYLSGIISTAIVLVVASLTFARSRNAAQRYESLEQKLPDACRLENLVVLREQAQQELDEIRERANESRLILTQRAEAERWLADNEQHLLSVRAEREEQERIRLEISRATDQLERERERQFAFTKEAQAAEVKCHFLRQQEQQLADELNSLAARRQSLLNEVNELDVSCTTLRSELAGVKGEIAASAKELQDARERSERSIAALDRHLKQVESQHHAAKAAFEKETQETRERSDRAIAAIEKQMKQVEGQRDSVLAEFKSVQERMTAAQAQLGTIQGQKATLTAEVKGLESQKATLEKQISGLRDDWQYLRVKTGQDEESERQRTAELWQPVISTAASAFPAIKNCDEMACLDKAQQYLRDVGLQFPQRVLWSFHTSLKVTDISPLVVLAGISGTGKSELPRRYAEAMGLHFLNVAVQPRWDSPQDMFGFFNYLENRYRATDLGRALIQMDPFHADKDRGWRKPDKQWDEHSLSKHLLIVLLDEMNLARVEYYFSEFLSRLEVRRGIKRNDAQDRRKAEIGLEVGSGAGQSPVMNVFVDRNVLFVGTMNEDETTQTLSDKVVDRANVLRFGRPGRLDRATTSNNGKLRSERLPYAAWQEWCHSEGELDDSTSEQVGRWIGQLNDALTRVRRPFAFRTQLAMRAYVANYPARDPDSVMVAMSDQIEQKILPKMRGFDPRDRDFRQTVSEVTGVLRELKDELLVQAVDDAMKGHQFAWMGVDRLQEEVALPVNQ